MSAAEMAAYVRERLPGGLAPGGLLALVAGAAPRGSDRAEVAAAVMLPVSRMATRVRSFTRSRSTSMQQS